MDIRLSPLGYVRGGRTELSDDDWGKVQCTIVLDAELFTPDALTGLNAFSHIEVVYFFHQVALEAIEWNSRHPRNNLAWPKVGILAQRGKNRPNRLGVSICKLIKTDALELEVLGLDAIHGTPILDIKPYITGFTAQGSVREPAWAKEIMDKYW